jgi:hypothetical protein
MSRHDDRTEIQEWRQIKTFVAKCRKLWPGAMIVLRPDPPEVAEVDRHNGGE